jgi:hypothetical protein
MKGNKGKVVYKRIAKDELEINRVFNVAFFLSDVVDYQEYCKTPSAEFFDYNEDLLFIQTFSSNFIIVSDFESFNRQMDLYLDKTMQPHSIFSQN